MTLYLLPAIAFNRILFRRKVVDVNVDYEYLQTLLHYWHINQSPVNYQLNVESPNNFFFGDNVNASVPAKIIQNMLHPGPARYLQARHVVFNTQGAMQIHYLGIASGKQYRNSKGSCIQHHGNSFGIIRADIKDTKVQSDLAALLKKQ
jgi:hypothetical protein